MTFATALRRERSNVVKCITPGCPARPTQREGVEDLPIFTEHTQQINPFTQRGLTSPNNKKGNLVRQVLFWTSKWVNPIDFWNSNPLSMPHCLLRCLPMIRCTCFETKPQAILIGDLTCLVKLWCSSRIQLFKRPLPKYSVSTSPDTTLIPGEL